MDILVTEFVVRVRDWSVITGGGGGASEDLPLRIERVVEKVLAMLKGGITSFGVVFTQ